MSLDRYRPTYSMAPRTPRRAEAHRPACILGRAIIALTGLTIGAASAGIIGWAIAVTMGVVK